MSHDRTHQLCVEIGELVAAQAPKRWRNAQVLRRQLGTFSTTLITYTSACSSEQTQDVDGLDELFHQLKRAEYKPEEGTWFRCHLEYSHRRKTYTASMQTFDREFPFGDDLQIPPWACMEELTMFPRHPKHTPPWMTQQ
ncbi:hypothetical protein [Microbispora catharanthi]|uniref:DUF600 family protein n=1 Tax=Microbispora catharanthi TaxID=1712871 RepID=A0A5N6C5E2_9ACTN|nr:hypothetical protein [Microbispora catharanthi]KAB8188035.1 hypothetical protein FH610_002625 [Microbispora catharanthi]